MATILLLAFALGRRRDALVVLSTMLVHLRQGRAFVQNYYRYHSAAFISSADLARSVCFGRTTPWATRGTSFACRPRPRLLSTVMATKKFNEVVITGLLEEKYKADLALLATKFGTMIESIDNIENVHVAELDGDHMQLEVIYCDREEATCVAVAVPISFPFHCDDEECVIDVIQELRTKEDVQTTSEVLLPKKKVSAELMETIATICVVMNRDFQDELVSFVRAFGANDSDRPTGACEMLDLTPDGFVVRAALFPEEPVAVSFPKECLSATDFQEEILALSERAMLIT